MPLSAEQIAQEWARLDDGPRIVQASQLRALAQAYLELREAAGSIPDFGHERTGAGVVTSSVGAAELERLRALVSERGREQERRRA